MWIFDQGHLSGFLGFTAGPLDPTIPVLLFCVVFGLSMDYEVFLLTRMQEAWLRTGDNRTAVATDSNAAAASSPVPPRSWRVSSSRSHSQAS